MTDAAAKPASRHWPSVAISSAAVFVILLLTIFLAPTKFDKESYLSICVDKQRLLHDTPSPKVVLIGGSNLATGLDSVLLESRIKRKIVNMGTCIQVGLGYMLREVEPEIKRGDVVVVIPEYEHWIDQFYGTKYLLMLPALLPDSIALIAPSYLRPSTSLTAALGDIASVAQKRARHFVPISLPSKDPDEGSTKKQVAVELQRILQN